MCYIVVFVYLRTFFRLSLVFYRLFLKINAYMYIDRLIDLLTRTQTNSIA